MLWILSHTDRIANTLLQLIAQVGICFKACEFSRVFLQIFCLRESQHSQQANGICTSSHVKILAICKFMQRDTWETIILLLPSFFLIDEAFICLKMFTPTLGSNQIFNIWQYWLSKKLELEEPEVVVFWKAWKNQWFSWGSHQRTGVILKVIWPVLRFFDDSSYMSELVLRGLRTAVIYQRLVNWFLKPWLYIFEELPWEPFGYQVPEFW